MPEPKTAQEIFDERIGPDDPARGAVIQRFGELKELQEQGDPAFQPGSRFFSGRHGKFVEEVLGRMDPFLDPTLMGLGGAATNPVSGSTSPTSVFSFGIRTTPKVE